MNRYSAYGPSDSPSLEEGDSAFLGVNDFEIRENLQPGICQAATNMDFTRATGSTRGGFVAVPATINSDFASAWVERTGAAEVGWNAIAYGAGLFVAVASSNSSGVQIMTSPDGITWTARTAASTAIGLSIVYGGSQFVAGSSSTGIQTSPDGITWTLRTGAESRCNALAYGGGKYVGVCGLLSSTLQYSADGITWSSAVSPISGACYGVAYGAGLFVAVSPFANGAVITSPDGITWTERTVPANAWYSVTYGGGQFVAVAASSAVNPYKVMTSPDGITWTARIPAAAYDWRSVAYGGNGYMAVASSGTGSRSMFSVDGIDWSLRATSYDYDWKAVAYGNGVFAAVGAGVSSAVNNAVMTSNPTLIFASGLYSDPNSDDSIWMVLAGPTSAAFYATGQTTRIISYPASYTVVQQSTIVQANNLLFIFAGEGQTPIQWDGAWEGAFIEVPASSGGAGFESVPESNQATYNQNRLWVVNGKDNLAASDVLDFEEYDVIANDFNLNTGSSDYVVCSYPFGNDALVVFKHNSSILLQNVQGSLEDVTATEITRQLGIVGINAVTAVGPDLIYMSDRNITSISLNLQNQLQASTEPLSRNIKTIMDRVNWNVAYKVSMAYWDNKLFVSLPLDNAVACNTVVVYNFITKQWWGEWNFDASLGLEIQGFVIGEYLGATRLHCVSEDGRIFVTDEGQNDISGTTVAEIAASLTTRAFRLDNNNRINRRMYADIGTNRPNFSVESFSEGASESSEILTDQTYQRSQTWLFNDSTYEMDNSNDDYNRAFRKDYATGSWTGEIDNLVTSGGDQLVDASGNALVAEDFASYGIQPGTGFQPEMLQEYRFPIITRRKGRLSWIKVTNTTGVIQINGIGIEARAGDRGDLVQVG